MIKTYEKSFFKKIKKITNFTSENLYKNAGSDGMCL